MTDELKQGRCIYCGQVQMIAPRDLLEAEASEGEADWLATERCKCQKAQRKRAIDAAHKAIDVVCVTDAKRRGMKPLSEEQVRGVKTLSEQVWDGELDGVTFKVDDFDQIRLKVRDDRVQVKRTIKIVAEAE